MIKSYKNQKNINYTFLQENRIQFMFSNYYYIYT